MGDTGDPHPFMVMAGHGFHVDFTEHDTPFRQWRIKVAQVAAPYVHPKPERAQAVDPEATAKQIEGPYKDLSKDPLYEAFQAYARGGAESSPNSKETPKS